MKKKAISIALLCIVYITTHAQFQLGIEEAEVIKQANTDGITKILKSYAENGTKVLTWDNQGEKAEFIVGFDDYGYSNMTLIMPYNKIELDKWIVTMSKYATRQNRQLWTTKIRGKFYTIKLEKFNPPGKMAFIIEQVKSEN